MVPVSLERVNENIQSLRKEVGELREIIQQSNRAELAKAAKAARSGKGNWTSLNDV